MTADIGPSPATVNLEQQQNTTHMQPASGMGEDEEETFYYDEATGAVYDSQGRLVEMPPGFQPPTVSNPQSVAGTTAIQPGEVGGEAGRETIPFSSLASTPGERASLDAPLGSRRAAYLTDPRISLDRKVSDASTVSRDAPLNHARSMNAFPSMDVLDEVEHLPSRQGSGADPMTPNRTPQHPKDVGMTATGAPQLDSRGWEVAPQTPPQAANGQSSIRQRNNRLSQFADAGLSPSHDLKFQLGPSKSTEFDEEDYSGEYDKGLSLGQGPGLAHPAHDGETAAGARGLRMVELEMELEDDSPYPEVRASVSNTDDPDMVCSTFRAYVLAFVLSTIAGGANILFSFRYPAPSVAPVVVQLITYPLGKIMAAVLPTHVFTLPKWLGGGQWSLNPGMFNIKEHALVAIAVNASVPQAYCIACLTTLQSDQFYGDPKPVGFSIIFLLSSQLIGLSFAGICRRWLVWPASMIWPQNLVTSTILNTLHAEEDGQDGSMTRFRYFSIVFGSAIIWYIIPGFLFQALSQFSWLCWILPNNHVVNTLFGTGSGLGMSVLTFDWTQINYISSPLIVPWWAELNIFVGFTIVLWIVAPVLYYTNFYFFSYLPFNSTSSYDRTGSPYNISMVVTNRTEFNDAAYRNYSQLYLPTTFYLVYYTSFIAAVSILVHTGLYHGKALWKGMRHVRIEEDDVHAKFMRRYREVPDWWYAVILLVFFAMAVALIEVYDTELPVWGLLLALIIPAFYILPSGFIFAMTGSYLGTNFVGEFVAGYALPGKAIANMVFKVYSLQTLTAGLGFVQDLKLGHYMKVPPRQTFMIQLLVSAWVSVAQIGVMYWMFNNVEGLCTDDEPHRFVCPSANAFFTSSVVWGLIGPQRLFGDKSLYSSIYWSVLIGAVLPLPFWLAARRWPKSWIKFVSVPVAVASLSYIPPGSGINYSAWFLVGFGFQYLVRRLNFRWWSKYNFVTSAALDAGTIISTILVFIALQYPDGGNISLNWWGNDVFVNTIDAQRTAYLQPPPEGFGPPPREL